MHGRTDHMLNGAGLTALPHYESAVPGALGDRTAQLSVFIMTHNEEVNIERCLRSVRWANDIVLLDSGSTDRTLAIARRFGNVRVYHRSFDDFGSQRNYGLLHISYPNPWVLVLDADEVVSPELRHDIEAIIATGGTLGGDAFLLRRSVMLDGKRLRRNLTSNGWIGRLLRVGGVHFIGGDHDKAVFDGSPGLLRGRIDHYQFQKGIDDWLERRTRYAAMENRNRCDRPLRLCFRELRSRDRLGRRAALKNLFY